MTDLKPCPACGEKAAYFTGGHNRVRCDGWRGCMATKFCQAPGEAATIWNSMPRRGDAHPGQLLTAEPAIDARTLLAGMAMQAFLLRTPAGDDVLFAQVVSVADDLLAKLAREPG